MTEQLSEKAVRIARSILDGSTPLVLGCKQLVGPLAHLGVHRDEPFVAITGVDTETDEFPVLPSERAMWNKQRLAEKDAQLEAWLPEVRDSVMTACRAVIERFAAS